jgi:copper chaperone
MQSETFQITGMSCGHCVGAVRGALAALKGVEVQEVTIGRAALRFDPAVVSREAIVDAIEDQGYEVGANA